MEGASILQEGEDLPQSTGACAGAILPGRSVARQRIF